MSDEIKGRAKGGIARREALSAERRAAIAKKAAGARWGRELQATHKGSFKEEFGIDVECYVLDDEQKTAVISQRGMGAALGLSQGSGASLPRFIKGSKITQYLGADLSARLGNPLVFQWSPVVQKTPPTLVNGYDATILIDICKAVIQADHEGRLHQRYARVVDQARIILSASAKAGIKGLVYALAGYDATRAEIISAFKFYVREEAREYEKEFPEQLYSEWYRLYQIRKPEKGKTWKFRHLTVKQVYVPLANSNGQILEMLRSQKAAGSHRYAKLHQFLAEVGVKRLRTHLGQLLGIAQISRTKEEYEKHVRRVFGGQQDLFDLMPDDEDA